METKKRIYFDANSWLVPYLERSFSAIQITPTSSLWEELVGYYRSETGECDYLFDEKGDSNSLFPRFFYKRDSHTLVLEGFDWVCLKVKAILVDDYLTAQLVQDSLVLTQQTQQNLAQQGVKSGDQLSAKRSFFQKLIGKKPVTISQPQTKEKVSGTLEMEFSKIPLQLPEFDNPSLIQSLADSAVILADTNHLSLSQAREILFKKSYEQRAACADFLSRLESEQVIKNGALTVTLNLTYLAKSGFLSLPQLADFQKQLTSGSKMEWELESKIFNSGFSNVSDDSCPEYGDLFKI